MEQLLPFALIFVAMYFVLIRPQQQRVKQQRALLTSLAVGDEVVTVGGLLGRIVELDDESATIETLPGTRLRFRRGAISGRVGEAAAPGAPEAGTVGDAEAGGA